MSKTNISQFKVLYPEKEKAYAFVNDDGRPFENVVVGITNPLPYYKINAPRGRAINIFEYILEGEGEVIVDGKRYTAKAGDVYILREGEPHIYCSKASNPWKKLWINYSSSYMLSFLDAYGIKSGVYHNCENTRALFEKAYECASSGDSYTDIGYGVVECLHEIIHTVAKQSNIASDEARDIKETLNRAVYERVGLDELAERIHMSKSNIIRVFKKKYGVTPYEYILSLKISNAKILLKDTNMTVKEIAEILCFSDERHFSTQFLKRVGVRPRQYRQNLIFYRK